MTEVGREQLRVPVEPESADHQPLEMPQQEIREIERADLGFRELREHRGGRVELVAVRPGQTLDAFLGEYRIELSPGAAVAVGDEDRAVMAARGPDQRTYRGRDALG